jgi:diguanylate cyclase (GGDEF)-like protein/PAS domain S-box-containing protein
VSDISDARFILTAAAQTEAPPAFALALIEALSDAVWLVRAGTLQIAAANQAACLWSGMPLQELLKHPVTDVVCTPEDLCFWSEVAAGKSQNLESAAWLLRRGVQNSGDSQATAVLRKITHLNDNFYMVLVHDRSEVARVEDELEQRMAELAATLESTAEGILVLDLSGRIRNFNQKFAAMWGIPMELLCRSDDTSIFEWMRQSTSEPQDYSQRLTHLHQDVLLQTTDILQLKSGQVFESTTLPQKSRGRPMGRVFSFRDISAQVEASRRIDALSTTDALTGLPNFRVLSDRVEFAVAMARRDGHSFSLLFVNLDRFNHVNETLGHAFGDCVLFQAAVRLRGCLRQVDTVARLGADEFVLLIHHCDMTGAALAARRVIETMQAPFSLEGISFNVTCSIGIALYPNDGANMDELLRHADASMHEAKAAGRGNFRFRRRLPQDDDDARLTRLKLDHAMRQALAMGRFCLHYQPQLDMLSGQAAGAEALIRWNDPELGLISPVDFIPVAEETGFIIALGDWVMREAIAQAARWYRDGRRLTVSVNVSALQFQQPEFVHEVTRTLVKNQLPAQMLELELTESILIQNAEEAVTRLGELADLGVKLAIDDFGTGYSSLGYLKRFPIGRLKIDRSFVQGLPGDESDSGIVRAIVNLGHALRLKIVAEGVETEAQRTFLESLGCGQYQGFLFSPALGVAAFEALLDSHVARPAAHQNTAVSRLIRG